MLEVFNLATRLVFVARSATEILSDSTWRHDKGGGANIPSVAMSIQLHSGSKRGLWE